MKNVARDRHGCRYRRAWSANEDRQETAAIGEQHLRTEQISNAAASRQTPSGALLTRSPVAHDVGPSGSGSASFYPVDCHRQQIRAAR